MNLDYPYIYFLGIGGIGMSNLALFFTQKKKKVFGYDLTKTALTEQLTQQGIEIHYQDSLEKIPTPLRENVNTSLIIYTPAIVGRSKILDFCMQQGYACYKRAEVLGMSTKKDFNICIAGTHGKTTITGWITHITYYVRKKIRSFIGGMLKGYDTNFLEQISQNQKDIINIIEADEFDRSFLHLSPNWGVISSIDLDHTDIYRDSESLESAFHGFVKKIKEKGKLFIHQDVNKDFIANLPTSLEIIRYGLNGKNVSAENIKIQSSTIQFDYVSAECKIKKIQIPLLGKYNVENALVSIRICLELGIPESLILEACRNFLGIKRRFEYILQNSKRILIDDYAHHPTAIQHCLEAVKQQYPRKKLTVIFQPHLYSRTLRFAKQFAKSLAFADEVIFLPIYPAREEPIADVTEKTISKHLPVKLKQYFITVKELKTFIQKHVENLEVVVSLGAGRDLEGLIPSIQEILSR